MYDIRMLTREEQEAIARQFAHSWKPIGDLANEIVLKLDRLLDPDWVSEYLTFHDARAGEIHNSESHL